MQIVVSSPFEPGSSGPARARKLQHGGRDMRLAPPAPTETPSSTGRTSSGQLSLLLEAIEFGSMQSLIKVTLSRV